MMENESIVYGRYARKSSEDDERQVQSIPDQTEALEELASRHQLTVTIKLSEEKYAKEPHQRPVFAELVSLIERGEINGILCWHANRLFRNPVDGGVIRWLLQTRKLKEIRTPERIYRPEDNAAILAIEESQATQYSVDLGKAVTRGLYSKADKGWRPGVAPPGYLNVKEHTDGVEVSVIRPDPERFNVIRRVWDLLSTGAYTVPQALEELNSWGYLSRKTRKGGGKPMTRSNLYRLLGDPFYAGTFYYGGTLRVGLHEPMVTQAEFDRVQRLIRRSDHSKPEKHEFPFTGFIRCGVCGCLITAERKVKFFPTTGNRSVYTYYHCTGRKGCPKDSVSEDYITEEVVKLLSRFAQWSPAQLDWLEGVIKRDEMHNTNSEVAIFNRNRMALDRAKQKLSNLVDMRVNGEISAGEFQDRRQGYQGNVTKFTKAVQDATRATELVDQNWDNAFDYAKRAFHEFDSGSARGKRMIARKLTAKAVLTLGKLELTIDPLLSVFATFEPPRYMGQTGSKMLVSPGLRASLDRIRKDILSGELTFGKLL